LALTPSTMLPLGTALPTFRLPTLLTPAGEPAIESAALPAEPVLVLFLCAHCPFVIHVEAELSRIDADYGERLTILAIASNSQLSHPQDGPLQLAVQRHRCGWRFPYLLDQDQSVAQAFRAACTPDLFLFGADHRLLYRGQLDASRPGNGQPPDGRDLRAALEAVLAGEPVNPEQTASIGCNIKWHPGKEPAWI